ncbi:hypothetical protein Strain138_001907 [Pseudogemmatithrix spongiicola]|uniref:Sortilin N-terminal domain-containing protein n=1 Tax=Pseudogemmatithrix spongiicola TaxID=3062599 RepID=A0AA49JV06_9BACT|nr:hypothetical protein Strain138_001907 [Gemmatimonadaceae bacterium 'strain 138']WKW15517.1 hypothetical protein Strain318_001906 [Gemmatimonadaceae bacterium 'strain 318']
MKTSTLARRVLGACGALALLASATSAQIPVAEELNRLHFRSIGPATMSGRIADVAVSEKNPALWYVATAHGGVWKTTSGGTTWEPMLQDQGLMSIGDVTLSQQNPDLVWAGGGESNNRQSTSWGSGVWKSTDGGKTWTNMGLRESKHIHRIVIDPTNNDIVFVAATGPLFGPGGERGIYKTIDGGRSWRRVLAGDDDTGGNDIVMSAADPKVLFASTYQRRRSECCFNGGGPGSGLFKSTDGGETWARVAGGYPSGELGRIAVDIARSNPNIVYSLVEAPAPSAPAAGAPAAAAPAGGSMASSAPANNQVSGLWRSDDGGATWTRVNGANPRPMYFSKLAIDPSNAETVYFGGVGLHMTLDGGKTVETDAAMVTHDDIHALWVNPANPQHLVIGNDGGMAVSFDQAKSWQFVPNLPVGLFYHVSYDMSVPFNICGGMQDNYNWCGPSRSRFSRGIVNHDWFQILGGDGFHAIPDLRDPRIVYTESQNGNMIRRNVVTGESKSIRPTPNTVTPAPAAGETFRFQWDAPILLSPHDPGTLYVAGNRVFRSTDRGDSWTVVSPDLTMNANRDSIVTMGKAGRDIRIATHDGISQWPALVSLAESPAQRGVLWAGSDDGVVSVTKDGGTTWTNVAANLPGFPRGAYIGEVVPSRGAPGRAYVVVPNYRQNDYAPYVWSTEDFGATFRRIDAGLRGEVVRTLTEDIRNPDVLYVGTETGLFVSLDRGNSWRRFKSNLPDVRVDEIAIHPRDNAMIVGTHGRAIFVLDNLAPVQELAAAQSASRPATLFTPTPALQWKTKDDRNDECWGHQWFTGENPPSEAVLPFHVQREVQSLELRVVGARNAEVRRLEVPAAKRTLGLQAVCWDMRVAPVAVGAPPAAGGPGGQGGPGGGPSQQRPIPGVRAPLPDVGFRPENPCGGAGGFAGGFGFGGNANLGPYVAPGRYTVELIADGSVVDSKPLTVVADPALTWTVAERAAYDRLVMQLHDEHRRSATTVARLNTLRSQLSAAQQRADSLQLSADERASLAQLKARLDSVGPALGVGIAPQGGGAGGGGGGGGFGGGAGGGNAYSRFTGLKASVIGLWEMPSAGVQQQLRNAQQALVAPVRDAERLLADAVRVGRSLQAKGVQLAP